MGSGQAHAGANGRRDHLSSPSTLHQLPKTPRPGQEGQQVFSAEPDVTAIHLHNDLEKAAAQHYSLGDCLQVPSAFRLPLHCTPASFSEFCIRRHTQILRRSRKGPLLSTPPFQVKVGTSDPFSSFAEDFAWTLKVAPMCFGGLQPKRKKLRNH